MDRSAQLAEILRRSEPLPLHLTLLAGSPWSTGKNATQHDNLLRVFSNCLVSRMIVSLEVHLSSREQGQLWESLLRASAPLLRDLFLGINNSSPQGERSIVPGLAFSESRPTSLYLHLVDPQGLGTGLFHAIPDCFAHLTHLGLLTDLACASLGRSLSLILSSCRRLTDLTLLWLMSDYDDTAHHLWVSPPATSALKRLRVVLPSGDYELAHVVRTMRRNLPHLNLCIRTHGWDRCCVDESFVFHNVQTVRLTAILCHPVTPRSFTFEDYPGPPAVLVAPQLTMYHEMPSGDTFYIRTIGGSVYAAQEVIRSTRRLATPPCELGGLVSITIAEAFWDALAGSLGSLPLLRTLEILIASRSPGVYQVGPSGRQIVLFSERMECEDISPTISSEPHKRAPYSCACLRLETLRIVQDPHFANATGERAVEIEAWQIARFIEHQLGWASQEFLDSDPLLQLVLQRVELAGRDPADERQGILNRIAIEQSWAFFVHDNVEPRWDRPYNPVAHVFV